MPLPHTTGKCSTTKATSVIPLATLAASLRARVTKVYKVPVNPKKVRTKRGALALDGSFGSLRSSLLRKVSMQYINLVGPLMKVRERRFYPEYFGYLMLQTL